jgi:hypothetical protein
MRCARLLLFFLFLSTNVWAERQALQVAIEVHPLDAIEVDTYTIAFPTPTAEDLDRGYIEVLNALQISLWSNSSWALSLGAFDQSMGTVDGISKPVSDLQWRYSGEATYTPLSQSSSSIQNSNDTLCNGTYSLDMRVLTSWLNDPPGNYSATLIFTINTYN